MKNEQELVFFDLETTGLDAHTDQIIEIGAVKVHNGKEIARFEQFCRLGEGARLPEFISALTGIMPLDLEPAEPVDQVIDEFLQFAGEDPLLAHNSGFDAGFLQHALHGSLSNPVYDTLELARIFFPTFQSHSLIALLDSLDIKKEEAHRALGDALSLFRFYRKLKDKIAQLALPASLLQRLAYLYPAVTELGLIEVPGPLAREIGTADQSTLATIFGAIDRERLPRLKTLRQGISVSHPAADTELLSSGTDVFLEADAKSLPARYLGDLFETAGACVVLLRTPSALDPLLKDASDDDGSGPRWILQESPEDLVCLARLEYATRSAIMQHEFGFELAALLLYEWETHSVFIPDMPLFLKKSRLIPYVASGYCPGEAGCSCWAVCPLHELLARAGSARFHVTGLSDIPHVLATFADDTPLMISSPETEKLMTDVLEIPEQQVGSTMLRIIAGTAQQEPGLAEVADSASHAEQLLESLYRQLAQQEKAAPRGRVTLGENAWNSTPVSDLRRAADNLASALDIAGSGLPPSLRAIYAAHAQALIGLLNHDGDSGYAVWMERQGEEILLAGGPATLVGRIRLRKNARFFLAGTSICPSGNREFLPRMLGFSSSAPPVIVQASSRARQRVPTFVTLHLPRPSESGFEKKSAQLIAETMRRFPGKAAVVSNSLETLRRMQSFLAREQGLLEYGLLLPKNGHTRTQLLQQFADQDKAILLIPFDYLSFGDVVPASFLFVTKLQFPNSFLPIVTRLKQVLKEQKVDAFRQFDLPYALALLQYTLRQMDPATLRAMFILDNRSFSTTYADRIRTVLPTPSLFLPVESQESLLQHLDRWIQNQTL